MNEYEDEFAQSDIDIGQSDMSMDSKNGTPSSPSKGNDNIPVANSLTPITASQLQIIIASDQNSHIIETGGRPFKLSLVSIVGKLESINIQEKITTFIIDDGFKAECNMWMDENGEGIYHDMRNDTEVNTYVRVIGNLKVDEYGRKSIVTYSIKPIVDPNEITLHYLEVVLSHQRRVFGALPEDGKKPVFKKKLEGDVNKSYN
ncbi:replication protein A subunit A [Acrasis kona]|uniref:Replication protein A subunit A n=1 Tax=Acrasis kona TaxID=1008807 RepID=A0AAW2ZG65_9EUKA